MNDVTIKEIREFLSPIMRRNKSLSRVLLKYRDTDELIQYCNCITKIQQHQYVLSYICGFEYSADREKQYVDVFIEWIYAGKNNTFGFKNILEMTIACISDVKTAIQNASVIGSPETMKTIEILADHYHISTSLPQKCRNDIFLRLFNADMDMVIAHLKEIQHMDSYSNVFAVIEDIEDQINDMNQFDELSYSAQMEIVRDVIEETVLEFPKVEKLIRLTLDNVSVAIKDFPNGNSYGKVIFDIGVGWNIDAFADPFPFINNKYRALAFCKGLRDMMIREISSEMHGGAFNSAITGNVMSIEERTLQILNEDMPSFINKLRINLGLPDHDESLDDPSEDEKGEDVNIRILQKYFPKWFDHDVDGTDKSKSNIEVASRICRAILELGRCGNEE